MSHYRVLLLARENTRVIHHLLTVYPNFGDLHNQIARAAISVPSNIAEGLGSGTSRMKRRGLFIARGSNNELAVQMDLLVTDTDHPIFDQIDHVGRMLTKLIRVM